MKFEISGQHGSHILEGYTAWDSLTASHNKGKAQDWLKDLLQYTASSQPYTE